MWRASRLECSGLCNTLQISQIFTNETTGSVQRSLGAFVSKVGVRYEIF
jgi:hypothetical protein